MHDNGKQKPPNEVSMRTEKTVRHDGDFSFESNVKSVNFIFEMLCINKIK